MANTITAIGAPGSLMRRFQEQPQLGVDLLRALKELHAEFQRERDSQFKCNTNSAGEFDSDEMGQQSKLEIARWDALLARSAAAIAKAKGGAE